MYCAVQEQLDVYFINWEKTFDRVPSSPNMAIQKTFDRVPSSPNMAIQKTFDRVPSSPNMAIQGEDV